MVVAAADSSKSWQFYQDMWRHIAKYSKNKAVRQHAQQALRRGRGLSIFNCKARRGWVVNATPRPLYPVKEDLVRNIQKLGGHRGLSEWVWKTSPPPGFASRTLHPIASPYTLYDISAVQKYSNLDFINTPKTVWTNFCTPYVPSRIRINRTKRGFHIL